MRPVRPVNPDLNAPFTLRVDIKFDKYPGDDIMSNFLDSLNSTAALAGSNEQVWGDATMTEGDLFKEHVVNETQAERDAVYAIPVPDEDLISSAAATARAQAWIDQVAS